jgi:hypothetical protein
MRGLDPTLKGRSFGVAAMALIALGGSLLGCGHAETSGGQADHPLVVGFAPAGGTFVESASVSLAVGVPAAQIHYTLDGTMPSAASPRYGGPIQVTRSTRLRAIAIAPSGSGSTPTSGPVSAQAYLRIGPDAAEFVTHLPVVVVHTFDAGELDDGSDARHVAARLQVFEPVGTSTSLVGPAALDTRIGIHVRGQSSREFRKKQYAVELWDAHDQDLDLPLLGMPAHSDWVVSDPIEIDRSLIRNAFAYELSNSIGRYAPRTRFAEVFLVDGQHGDDLGMASYMGLFTIIEKIKRGADRLDLAKLSAGDLAEPEVSGGYILRLDPGDSDFEVAGEEVQFVYPRPEVIGVPARQPQVDYIRAFIADFNEAANAPGGLHPRSGRHYSEFIDQDSWIDHHIINALAKNPDGIHRSAYFHKPKGGKLVAGPVWDFDRTLGTREDDRATDPEGWRPDFGYPWWKPLFADSQFRERYRARLLQLTQDELSPASLNAIIDRLAGAVGDAAERNFARWPEDAPEDGHAAEITILKEFVRDRVAWLRSEMSDPDFHD